MNLLTEKNPLDIAELKSKSIGELHEMAEELDIHNFSGLRKQDLIFRIEQNLLDSDVVLRGEGVLEILPEGYGFLRSQDWNYLYGPDDIYVSPSQIKRFDMRTGTPPENRRQMIARQSLTAALSPEKWRSIRRKSSTPRAPTVFKLPAETARRSSPDVCQRGPGERLEPNWKSIRTRTCSTPRSANGT